ncbi:uncharacterized protein [Spinacia oleracea]|uniref:Uncharacterized protein isoform X2 n=1 Tax=Spinacia oleracea TaxID=3562 RepID=A0ABM3QN23_SPIOL|nr:uncharacterized protein LOC130460943 isoform X2 [Spinacia oleracea]
MCRLLVVVEFMLLHLLIVQEIYTRRMASCLTSDGIVINMVVGGEVVTLKSIEEGILHFNKEADIKPSTTRFFTTKSFDVLIMYFRANVGERSLCQKCLVFKIEASDSYCLVLVLISVVLVYQYITK